MTPRSRPARRRHATVLLLALLTIGSALSAVPGGATPPAREPADPTATADGERRGTPTLTITGRGLGVGTVSPGIVGGNLRWVDQADGAWNPRTRRVRPQVARLVRRLGVGSIRYPGGTVANLWDHRRALAKPGCQVSGGFAAPHFGPISARRSGYTIPRHAQFSRLAGTRTNLMVPMVNTTVADARGFVRAVARATGQRRIVVEIGNEAYLNDQRYWRAWPLPERLEDYIRGGTRRQSGDPGDVRLYRASGCDLLHPARANGRPRQTYRPRYTPISTADRPVVRVGDQRWTWVRSLAAAGPRDRVFALSADRTRIVFGDGRHGAKPRGPMRIDYSAGPMLGFADLYRGLQDVPGVDVQVCSSWATLGFIRRMRDLGLDYDCIGVHQYRLARTEPTVPRVYPAYMAGARATNRDIEAFRRAMQNNGHRERFLIVTEFGMFHASRMHFPNTFMMDLVRAVQYAGQIRSGVRISNVANLDALHEQYGERYTLSGTGHLTAMVGRLVGQTPVKVLGVPSSSGLTVAATRRGVVGRGGTAGLFVVNTQWRGSRSVRIRLPGRRGPACVTVRTLSASPGVNPRPPGPGKPRSVRPTRTRVWRGPVLRQRFGPHSVSLLTFRQRGRGGC